MNNEYKAIQDSLVKGEASNALALAIALVRKNPADATSQFLLASAYRANGRTDAAKSSIQQALLLQPFHPGYHTLLAEIHLDEGLRAPARSSLEHALKAKADFAAANSLMGVIEMEDGHPERALPYLERAARADTATAQHKNNLGVALLALGRGPEAEAAFNSAVLANPDYFAGRYNLVRALIKRGADADAAIHLQVLLSQQPDHQECLFMVGNLCHRNGDFATAAEYLRRAAEKLPVNSTIVNAFAEFCWEQGDVATAIELYNVSAAAEPLNVRAALGRYLSLPMVAPSRASLSSARSRFSEGLRTLENQLPMLEQRPAATLLRELQWTNFLLAYQGEDDRPLQEHYGRIVGHLTRKALPRYAQPRTTSVPPKSVKPKIGFLSTHFYTCTAGKYFASWITDLPQGKYDITIYDGSAVQDGLTRKIHAAATTVRKVYAADLEQLADLIATDDLDVLIYPELGMQPQLFPLGSLRLAHTQVTGWGHPVTTGLGAIDYFLSSAEMEPADAAAHYTEKLHLLPGLGTRYEAPQLPAALPSREQLNLPGTGTLYLVPQSLYKIHPDNDAILAEVLRLDPTGTLIMFATDRHKVATTVFVQRLQNALREAGVAPEGRVRMLPQTSHEHYLAINQHCSVMLDTLHWSGGNTTLDALAAGLPVLTTEGRYMRGRQSAAMLRMIGVPELIVANPAELAQRAVALANDVQSLSALRGRILAGQSALFGQQAPVQALDDFLSGLIRRQ